MAEPGQAQIVPPEMGSAGGETPTGNETPTVEELMAERERMRSALSAANKEAAERRKKLEALEQAEAKRQQAEMTELERVKAAQAEQEARYQKLAAEHDGLRLRQAFFDEVAKQSITFASDQARADAYSLADLTAALDGGEIQGKALADAIKTLRNSRPYLFGQPAAAPDIGATARGGDAGLPAVTDEDVQEFAARMGIPERFVDKKALAQMKRLAAKGQ